MMTSRDGLVAAILEFLSGQDLLTLSDVRVALEREIDSAGPDALVALKTRLTSDNGWNYYPRDPLTWVVPVGLAGLELLFPVADSTLHPARVVMQILLSAARDNRRVIMDAVGLAIAELVPVAYRGVYEDASRFVEAGTVLQDSRAAAWSA
jgi:hypothetical protein